MKGQLSAIWSIAVLTLCTPQVKAAVVSTPGETPQGPVVLETRVADHKAVAPSQVRIKLRHQMRDAALNFPVEAIHFYSVLGAFALYDCTARQTQTPAACLDYINQLTDPLGYVSFLSFTMANNLTMYAGGVPTAPGPLANFVHLLNGEQAGQFKIPGTARMLMLNQIGFSAGMFLQTVTSDLLMDPSFRTAAALMFSKRTPMQEESYNSALADLEKRWFTREGLSRLAPMAISSSLSGVMSTYLSMKGPQWWNTLRAASNVKIIKGRLVLKGVSVTIHRLNTLKKVARAASFLVPGRLMMNFVTMALFIGLDRQIAPIVEAEFSRSKALEKIESGELALGETLTSGIPTVGIYENDRRNLISNSLFRDGWEFDKEEWSAVRQLGKLKSSLVRIDNLGSSAKVDTNGRAFEIQGALSDWNKAQVAWRGAISTEFNMALASWQGFVQHFYDDVATAIDFYSSLIEHGPSIKVLPETGRSVLAGLQSGALLLEDLRGLSQSRVNLALRAKSTGLLRGFYFRYFSTPDGNLGDQRLDSLLKYLDSKPAYEKLLLVEAINRGAEPRDAAQMSVESLEQFVVSNQYADPYVDPYELITGTSRFNLGDSHSRYFIRMNANGVVYYNTIEKLFANVACGEVPGSPGDLVSSSMANMGQTILKLPQILNKGAAEAYCRNRNVGDSVLDGANVSSSVEYISKNLDLSRLATNANELDDKWFLGAARVATQGFLEKQQDLVQKHLYPVWFENKLSSSTKWGFRSGIKQAPEGLRRSLLAQLDVNLRVFYFLIKDGAKDRQVAKNWTYKMFQTAAQKTLGLGRNSGNQEVEILLGEVETLMNESSLTDETFSVLESALGQILKVFVEINTYDRLVVPLISDKSPVTPLNAEGIGSIYQLKAANEAYLGNSNFHLFYFRNGSDQFKVFRAIRRRSKQLAFS